MRNRIQQLKLMQIRIQNRRYWYVVLIYLRVSRERRLLSQYIRKLVMEYLGKIDTLPDLDFAALATRMKIDESPLFLVDFCSLLYEKAVGYYEKAKNAGHSVVQFKAFKIGHVLVNSNQAGFIQNYGFFSLLILLCV
jgi:hypothetical protein